MENNLEKEFVPYEEALALKELGFNGPCYKYIYIGDTGINVDHYLEVVPSKARNYNEDSLSISQPTFSQAFRFFREKYWYTALILCDSFRIVKQLSTSKTQDFKTGEFSPVYITQQYHKEEGLKSYDESELACLKKLIEISKEKQNGK
jgi:hypothetical protein